MNPQQLSQSVVLGFQGTNLSNVGKDFIETYQPAGFIFFKDNCHSTEQVHLLLKDIKKQYRNLIGRDPWLCIDHEGGAVHRLPKPITHFQTAQELGKKNKPSLFFKVGKQMAEELKDLGFNLNFAPVCDVQWPQTAEYLSNRIYGESPEFVSQCCEFLMKGLQEHGIMACAKHFPGIGSAQHDPHKQLIQSNLSVEDFEEREWEPFKHLINTKVDAIMTSHIVCENLDPDSMATFSYHIVSNVLKKQLNFHSLIFSDDLKMGAIQSDVVTSTLEAFVSGHHLLIYSERDFETNATYLEELNKSSKQDRFIQKQLKQVNTLSLEKLKKYSGK